MTTRVIHPLDDLPETKLSPEGLGRMAMNPAVRWSLILLRSYLAVIMALVLYRVIFMVG
ncbi:MAG TPA: hypothetical protein VKT70_11790 [Stellaceae bacterium]|nr:hypothetical protein [Stellaceae bacterium]